MAEVILDGDTRAPSSSWAKVVRICAAALAAKLAIWLSGWGVQLDAGDQVALVTLVVAIAGAVGTEARNRGWPVLRLLAVPLALVALSGPVGCASAKVTPAKAFAAAAGTYETLAVGMAIYCEQPEAHADACIRAAKATLTAERILASTRAAVDAGTATDAQLDAATDALEQVTPELRRVQP